MSNARELLRSSEINAPYQLLNIQDLPSLLHTVYLQPCCNLLQRQINSMEIINTLDILTPTGRYSIDCISPYLGDLRYRRTPSKNRT